MTRRPLTDTAVRKLTPRKAPYPDPGLPGFYVYAGPIARTGMIIARRPDGEQLHKTVADLNLVSIEEAHDSARTMLRRVRAGLPPEEPPAETLRDVGASWLKRHVRANGLRTADQYERVLTKYLYPTLGDRDFRTIRRSEYVGVIDRAEDAHGKRQAHYVKQTVSALTRWYASRTDDYTAPLVGTRSITRAAAPRERTLSDDELRLVIPACQDPASGVFGKLALFGLLTAQRREKLATLRWQDIDAEGIWRIPRSEREKGTPEALRLPPMALEIVKAQPVFAGSPFVFAGRFGDAFNGFSPGKERLDSMLPPDLPRWTLHDLRRTSRSLLARAGVTDRVAEMILGHAITGVEGVYNRFKYVEEMSDGLARLGGLIECILNPPPAATVVRLHPARAS